MQRATKGRKFQLFCEWPIADCPREERKLSQIDPVNERSFSPMKKQLFLILAMSMPLFAQTVTFTTSGGATYPEHYTVISEGGQPASGIVQIAQDYGYTQSGIVLPNNPTAPGWYLNPVITITAATYVGKYGDPTRTVTYTFNSISDPMYGYTWSGTFTATLVCTHYYRGRCNVYEPTSGSGMMMATAVN